VSISDISPFTKRIVVKVELPKLKLPLVNDTNFEGCRF